MTDPILILGASSGIGRAAMEEALSRDLAVRAFSRTAQDLPERAGLERMAGDAADPADMARAVAGAGAVIYALGVTERLAMLWQTETLFSETTRILLDAMATAGVARLVAVTGFGAGRSRQAMSTLEKAGHKLILGRPYADKDRQEEMILASDTDYTIVRPVILTNGRRTAGARVLRDPATWRNGLVSRAEVAAYLIDAVEQGLDIRADVVLAR